MDTMFPRLKPVVGGVLLAILTGCASEEPIQGHPGDGGFVFASGGAWSPSVGGSAGTPPDPSATGGTTTSPQDSGGMAGVAGPGSGGDPPFQTGGSCGAGITGGASGAAGGSAGACLFGLCPPTGGAGGLGSAGGASGGSAGASIGGAAGANSCDNATCFDIFDCYLYFPQATACGFTKCEGLICKK